MGKKPRQSMAASMGRMGIGVLVFFGFWGYCIVSFVSNTPTDNSLGLLQKPAIRRDNNVGAVATVTDGPVHDEGAKDIGPAHPDIAMESQAPEWIKQDDQAVSTEPEKAVTATAELPNGVEHLAPEEQPVAQVEAETLAPIVNREVQAQASAESWEMMDEFYTSRFREDATSTTIIFNLFKGPTRALEIQLEMASRQRHVDLPEVWVMCFNSPMEKEYAAVVEEFRATTLPKIKFTVSNFNHKFHGRFLLAYMATTKYVLLVDDDKTIDDTTVHDYITYMRKQPGVWGNNGHLRASNFEGYKSWPVVGYDLKKVDYAEQDYLSGMWFLEQRWLEYFVKERPPSWATAEDMHLSHVMRKYLNLNTYGGKVALKGKTLPKKNHAATVGSALDLRECIFDHMLGRGNKVANVPQPIQSLVYAETVEDIEDFIEKLQACEPTSVVPWCRAGPTAVVFRGAAEQDVVGLIAAADKLCSLTSCEYLSVKPKIKHPIRHFNMREGYGQHGMDIPWQTAASDVLLSLTGVLNNVMPQLFFIPDVEHLRWVEMPSSSKKNRLRIYHDTVKLALQIHLSSRINPKWDQRAQAALDSGDAFPALTVYQWRSSIDDPSGQHAEQLDLL